MVFRAYRWAQLLLTCLFIITHIHWIQQQQQQQRVHPERTKSRATWKQQHVRKPFITAALSSLCAGRPDMFLTRNSTHGHDTCGCWQLLLHRGVTDREEKASIRGHKHAVLTWRWVRAAGCAAAGWAVCPCSGPGGWRWESAAPARTGRAWRGAWAPARSGLQRSGTWSWGREPPWSRPWTETPTQRWNWGVASSLRHLGTAALCSAPGPYVHYVSTERAVSRSVTPGRTPLCRAHAAAAAAAHLRFLEAAAGCLHRQVFYLREAAGGADSRGGRHR